MSFGTAPEVRVFTKEEKAKKRREEKATKLTRELRQETSVVAQSSACTAMARAPYYRASNTSSRALSRWNPASQMSCELMRSSALAAVTEAMRAHGSFVGGDATSHITGRPRRWEKLQLHGLDAITSLIRGVLGRHLRNDVIALEEGITERTKRNPMEMLARALCKANAASTVAIALLSAVEVGEREVRRVHAVREAAEKRAEEAKVAKRRAAEERDGGISPSLGSRSASSTVRTASGGDSKVHPFAARWVARAVQTLCALATVRDDELHTALVDAKAVQTLTRAMKLHLELVHGPGIFARLAATVKMKKAGGAIGATAGVTASSPRSPRRAGSISLGGAQNYSPGSSRRHGSRGPNSDPAIYTSACAVQQDGCSTMLALLDLAPVPCGFVAVQKADGVATLTRAMQYGLLAGRDIAHIGDEDVDYVVGLQACACCAVAKMLSVAAVASSVKVLPPPEVNVIRKRKLRARLKEAQAELKPHKHHMMLTRCIDAMGDFGTIEIILAVMYAMADIAEAQLACVEAVQTIAMAADKATVDVHRILYDRGARKLVREAVGRHSARVPPLRFVGYRAMKHLPMHRGGAPKDRTKGARRTRAVGKK